MDATVFRDLNAERSLLRYLLTTDANLSAFIPAEWFAGELERHIFQTVKELRTVLPAKAINAEIIKRLPETQQDILEPTLDDIYAAEIIKNDKAGEIVSKQLRDLYQQRSVIETTSAAQVAAASGNLNESFRLLRSVGLLSSEILGVESGDYLEDFEARQQSIQDRQIDEKRVGLIPTGIIPLDEQTGGILRGEVAVVIASTGSGKSAGKLNIAANAWLHGFNVIFLGLEMSKDENQFRLDSLLTEIPATYFRRASLTKRDYTFWGAVIKSFREQRKNYFEFISGKGLTMADALSLVEGAEAKRGSKVDLFILDHIVLLNSGEDGFDQKVHIQKGRDFDRLLEFGAKRKIAIWTSSQSTDEGATRKEGMRTIDVKYSRAIAESAHLIVSLWQSEMEMAAGMLNCRIIKGRSVQKGKKLVLRPDFNRMVLDIPSWANVVKNTFGELPKKPKTRSIYSLDGINTAEIMRDMGNPDGADSES